MGAGLVSWCRPGFRELSIGCRLGFRELSNG